MPDNDDKTSVTEPQENPKVESARTPATDFISAEAMKLNMIVVMTMWLPRQACR